MLNYVYSNLTLSYSLLDLLNGHETLQKFLDFDYILTLKMS